MPKRVDHEVRRRQIAEAVWRIAAGRGLTAATLREVAAEAGVSVRLVQYYFETKNQLLAGALAYLTRAMAARMRTRLQALGRPPGPRDIIEICLVEALPTDEESLFQARVQGAYYSAALADPALVEAAAGGADPLPQDSMEKVLTAQIRSAQESGEVSGALDAIQEARSLGALAAGLSSLVLVNARTPAEAVAVVTYRLDRLFGVRP